jgi:acylphosphatase
VTTETPGRKAVHVVVEGRVQGVGYRDWVCGAARGLKLDGWVRNRADGAVEALFAGPSAAVDAMVGRCADGPRLARVRRMRPEPWTGPVEPGFAVKPTA